MAKRYDYDATHENGHVLRVRYLSEGSVSSFRGWLQREGYAFTETVTETPDPPVYIPEETA